jgi:hypothetical protein
MGKAPAIVVVTVELAVAVAVLAIMAVLLAGLRSFAANVFSVDEAVRAEGVCAVVNPGTERTEHARVLFANDRARAIAVRHCWPCALELWSLAVSPGFTRFVLPFDASGAGERAIIRHLVKSLVVVALAVLDHVAFAVVRPVVRPFASTLWQVHVRVIDVVEEVIFLASFDLLAIVGSKVAIDRALEAFSIPRFSRCAGAIRSMYHEVWAEIRVRLAA